MGLSSNNKKYREKNETKVDIPKRFIRIINSQLESICKIYINENKSGTGFLCRIRFPGELQFLHTLITSNKVINEEFFQKNNIIKISFDDDKISKSLEIVPERKFYCNETYDTSIIEIFPERDNLKHFLELDYKYDKNEKEGEQNIYLLHYLNGNEIMATYGNIIDIKEYEIEHTCTTEDIGSGGPIILFKTNKVIGVHKGIGRNKKENNYGTLLKNPINEFYEKVKNTKINEIIINLKIENEDINKDIYILNNQNYSNSDEIIPKVEELKEINKLNTIMSIDDNEVEYEKCKKFSKKGIYRIKISFKFNLKNSNCMFLGCTNIININFSSFDTKNIINMKGMFFGCNNLKNLDLLCFDTKNVTDMNAMFYGCNNLENLDLSSFDTKNVTDMGCMFSCCNYLININLSSFDTNNVTNMGNMFYGCNNLANINLSSFKTKNVTNIYGMFYLCNNLTNIDLSSFDTKKVSDMGCMFSCCNNLKNINLSSFDTKNVSNMGHMFYGCNNLTNINLSSFDTKNVSNMFGMFYGCNNLIKINLSSFDTKNVSDMGYMFSCCNKLTNINLLSFDTKNVTNMNAMFEGCNNLTNINLSKFDTKNVTDMNGMFKGCNKSTNIDLSSFDTKNVNDMGCMFYDCNNLTNINLSKFDTKNVINMDCMFYGCNLLTNIDLSNFKSEKNLVSYKNIFFNCSKLSKLKISQSFYQIIKKEIQENIQLITI